MARQHRILSVQHLQIDFKTEEGIVTAVKDLNFDLYQGEILGIVGESGSGKSVSSMAIMGILSKMAIIANGSIQYFRSEEEAIELTKLPEKQFREIRGAEISMIFQEPMTSLNPVIRCGEQVVEAIMLHQHISYQQAKQQTLTLFEEVKLPRPDKIFTSYPHQISGGQKQRVMIAMAISCKPKLLIADEPTTALDVRVQKTILEILLNLQKKYGLSIIFITHDLGVIAQIAQRVLVMYKGTIAESGSIDQIFNHSQTPYTQGLLNCRPRTDVRTAILPTVNDYLKFGKEAVDQKLTFISSKARQEQHAKCYQQDPMFQVQNLTTSFVSERNIFGKVKSSVYAVNEVSFDIYKGETLGLVGESGCGKTSLGRTILQMIPSSAGRVLYKGVDLKQLSKSSLRHLRREIQIIFQDPYSSLNPRLSIGEAILEPMTVHNILNNQKERKAKVIELLERVSLNESHFNRYPHEFSGGQRQRIVIARSLALKPEFIVCDESVSALDVSVQAQVLNLLNELKAEFGLTYLFISHDLSVVKYMSDRLLVMKDGKMVEMGESDHIYANPSQAYTRELIEAIPTIYTISK
jgi:peptide/nickel transport system ATP-binding protein